MTRDETRKILAVLRTAYPNFYRNVSDSDVTDTLNLWASMFTDDDPRLVAAAVKSIIVASNREFPPNIGTIKEQMRKLMQDDVAAMIFTDPPYNVNYGSTMKDSLRYHAGTLGGRKIMNDNLGDGFAQFLADSLSNLMMFNKGAVYICMSSSELHTLYNAFIAAGGKWSTFIIWAKNTFTLGRADYQRQYEPILYGWNANQKHYWCGDRDQSDVWAYNKPVKNDLHPTMKPVELVERAINNSSKLGDIVLDGFGGSGSTIIAAEKTGRKARLIELDPKFCDVIVRRWEEYTGQKAQLFESHAESLNNQSSGILYEKKVASL